MKNKKENVRYNFLGVVLKNTNLKKKYVKTLYFYYLGQAQDLVDDLKDVPIVSWSRTDSDEDWKLTG